MLVNPKPYVREQLAPIITWTIQTEVKTWLGHVRESIIEPFARAINDVIHEEARLYAQNFSALNEWVTGGSVTPSISPDQIVERWAIELSFIAQLKPTSISETLVASLGLTLTGMIIDWLVNSVIGTIAGVGMPVVGISMLILKIIDFAGRIDNLPNQVAEKVAQHIQNHVPNVEAKVIPKISQKAKEFREQFETALRASIGSDILHLQNELDQVINNKKIGEADLEREKQRMRNLSDRLDQLLNSINAELLGYIR